MDQANYTSHRPSSQKTGSPRWFVVGAILGVIVIAISTRLIYKTRAHAEAQMQRALTRLTFDAGVQFDARWSPDGRFIAYSSNRGGKVRHLGAAGRWHESRHDHQSAKS